MIVDDPAFRLAVVDADRQIVRGLVESTGFFRPDEVEVAVELVEQRLRDGDRSGYHFVFALDHGQNVGYACYGPIACTVGSFDLYWIAVQPPHQSKGWGRRLMGEAERLIRQLGGRNVYVETSGRPQYEPTRAFYRRCGYEIAATLPDFYAAGDDKVILVKALPPGP